MAGIRGAGTPGIFRDRRTYETPMGGTEHVDTVRTVGYSDGYLLVRRIVYYVLGVIEVLLLFRFALRLFGANPASPFAALIYGITDVLTYPFTGLFADVTAGRSVFEPRTLLAMAVYAVVAWGIDRLLRIVMKGDEPVIE